ncbi:hypothetical protein IFM89_030521 [Coptis chinensis]|uniref:RING-type E3 ubiquitin transferase n=1 Tax=Coptis chinensis TaxID=261450 RepID=A0A835LNW9_9MAGN|nr:hypothetical protein IFM89_030521 [Coptis chinensis]
MGDNRTRMFIYWTTDNSKSTGCFNQLCPGFVKVDASIHAGAEFVKTSVYGGKLYSVVKGLKIGKGALECAVCLNEFGNDETLRLLPKCDNVFHPECIDAWLASHTTCPVCRANLTPDSNHPEQMVMKSRSTKSRFL